MELLPYLHTLLPHALLLHKQQHTLPFLPPNLILLILGLSAISILQSECWLNFALCSEGNCSLQSYLASHSNAKQDKCNQ